MGYRLIKNLRSEEAEFFLDKKYNVLEYCGSDNKGILLKKDDRFCFFGTVFGKLQFAMELYENDTKGCMKLGSPEEISVFLQYMNTMFFKSMINGRFQTDLEKWNDSEIVFVYLGDVSELNNQKSPTV